MRVVCERTPQQGSDAGVEEKDPCGGAASGLAEAPRMVYV